MSQGIFDTIYGFTTRGVVSLGKKVKLKFTSAGILQARTQADDGFARLQAADPTGDDDLVTKRFYNANLPAGAASNVVKTIAIEVGTATADATEQIPNGAVIHRVDVDVTTAYSAGATLDVGSAGNTAILVANAVVDEEAAEFMSLAMRKTAPATFAPKVTVGGAPGAGAAVVVIHYSEPAA